MNPRRVASYIDDVLADRRPRRFKGGRVDANVVRAAIAMRTARPGEEVPEERFVVLLAGPWRKASTATTMKTPLARTPAVARLRPRRRAAFRKPSVRAAMIKDYRAGYGSDTEHDAADRAAGRKLKCPVLVLWANERLVAEGVRSHGATVVDVWRRWADEVSGYDVSGGHLIAEDASDDVIRLVPPFLEAAENRCSASNVPRSFWNDRP